MVGLWAVFFKSKEAAKLYMLSWPARFVLMVWGALQLRSLCIKYDVEQGPVGIVYLVTFIILLYYFKVGPFSHCLHGVPSCLVPVHYCRPHSSPVYYCWHVGIASCVDLLL